MARRPADPAPACPRGVRRSVRGSARRARDADGRTNPPPQVRLPAVVRRQRPPGTIDVLPRRPVADHVGAVQVVPVEQVGDPPSTRVHARSRWAPRRGLRAAGRRQHLQGPRGRTRPGAAPARDPGRRRPGRRCLRHSAVREAAHRGRADAARTGTPRRCWRRSRRRRAVPHPGVGRAPGAASDASPPRAPPPTPAPSHRRAGPRARRPGVRPAVRSARRCGHAARGALYRPGPTADSGRGQVTIRWSRAARAVIRRRRRRRRRRPPPGGRTRRCPPPGRCVGSPCRRRPRRHAR